MTMSIRCDTPFAQTRKTHVNYIRCRSNQQTEIILMKQTKRNNTSDNAEPQQDYQHRESIWSVPAKWRAMYFILFTLFAGVGLIMVISLQEIPPSDGRWNRLVVDIMREMAFVSTGSAGTAITITEIARYIMVIGEWMLREVIEPRRRRQIERWRQEGIAEGRQEGIEQGIEKGVKEGDKEWESWISRKMLAESRGEPFDEPMPSQLRNTHSNNSS